MMGGIDVRTPEQAEIYSRMLREPVQIGAHIEEPECMPEHDPRWQRALREGRECPRVDLDRDNRLPYQLLLLAGSDHTRPVFGPFFNASCGHLPAEERAAILSRVHAGLMSSVVLDRLYPKPTERS